jgi:hypothetical protein
LRFGAMTFLMWRRPASSKRSLISWFTARCPLPPNSPPARLM